MKAPSSSLARKGMTSTTAHKLFLYLFTVSSELITVSPPHHHHRVAMRATYRCLPRLAVLQFGALRGKDSQILSES